MLATVGLILPGLTRILPSLVAWAAAGLAVVTVSATLVHFSRGEISSGITTAILLVLTVFVAHMCLQVKPIAPRNAV